MFDRRYVVREQHGHSALLWLMCGWCVLYIPVLYYIVSPHHYFHL
jgi:hypothetical protein